MPPGELRSNDCGIWRRNTPLGSTTREERTCINVHAYSYMYAVLYTLKVNVCSSYVTRYLVLGTAQSALHFTPVLSSAISTSRRVIETAARGFKPGFFRLRVRCSNHYATVPYGHCSD